MPEDDDLDAAMNALSSPLGSPVLCSSLKRIHTDSDTGSTADLENQELSVTTSRSAVPTLFQQAKTAPTTNMNVVIAVKCYTEKKKLRADQLPDFNSFVMDQQTMCDAKLFVTLLALDTKLDKMISSAPVYQVSTDLQKNIDNYAMAVLLSNIILPADEQPLIAVDQVIITKYRFDLPTNIEHNHADFAKVSSAIQYALTQKRAKIKKMIQTSVSSHTDNKKWIPLEPPEDCPNIYNITQDLVEGTKCSVSIPLCACVALMRAVYLDDPTTKFWDSVDARLVSIREKASGDAKKITKAFRYYCTILTVGSSQVTGAFKPSKLRVTLVTPKSIEPTVEMVQYLKKDRKTHGQDYTTTLNEDVDKFQSDVDSMIEANNCINIQTTSGNLASSSQAQASTEPVWGTQQPGGSTAE